MSCLYHVIFQSCVFIVIEYTVISACLMMFYLLIHVYFDINVKRLNCGALCWFPGSCRISPSRSFPGRVSKEAIESFLNQSRTIIISVGNKYSASDLLCGVTNNA